MQQDQTLVLTPTEFVRAEGQETISLDGGSPRWGDGFLEGYQLYRCLDRSAGGDLWKAKTPRGDKCLVLLVFGFNAVGPGHGPLERLRALTGRGLAPRELVFQQPNRLAVITAAGDKSLDRRFRECKEQGLGGIPRPELLQLLGEAARTLDALLQEERLRHLCLNPRSLVVHHDNLVLADFGLVELLWLPGGQSPASLNHRYAAPEVLQGKVSDASDQYSLALIFQEMLTGSHPFPNLHPKQLTSIRLKGKPNLSLLSGTDRAILGKALHTDPTRRFASCTEMVRALAGGADGSRRESGAAGQGERPPEPAPDAGVPKACPSAHEIVAGWMAEASRGLEVQQAGNTRYLLCPEKGLSHHCHALLTPGTARVKVEGFRQHWHAEVRGGDEGHYVFEVRLSGSLWQRCLGRLPVFEMEINFLHPRDGRTVLTEVSVNLRPLNVERTAALELLQAHGPALLESLHGFLQVNPDRRKHYRLPWVRELTVKLVSANQHLGETVRAETRDISPHGMRLVLPCHPPTPHLLLQGDTGGGPRTGMIPARIMRTRPLGDGRFEVGVTLLLSQGNAGA